MKQREDYERETRGADRRVAHREEVMVGSITRISSVAPAGVTTPTALAIMVKIEGLPLEVSVELPDAEFTDKLIAALISARNKLWPGA